MGFSKHNMPEGMLLRSPGRHHEPAAKRGASMSNAVPIIRQADEGEQMWFAGGGTFTWKATAAETGGAFIMLEDRMAHGKTTPLHRHPNEDEAIGARPRAPVGLALPPGLRRQAEPAANGRRPSS
jgi:hypothetical protein